MNNVFEALQDRKMIFAGSIIDSKILEEFFGTELSEKDLSFKKLALKERIKMDGFFVTDRGCEGGDFRILRTDEMADYGEAKLNKNKNSNQKIALILRAHDINCLNEEQKKRHRFVQTKAAKCAASMTEELLKGDVL